MRGAGGGYLLAGFLVVALLAEGAAAERSPATTAVLDFVSEGFPVGQARELAALLRSELDAYEAFAVVGRSSFYLRLGAEEREKAAGCSVRDCAVAVGRKGEVERVVAGRIEQVDGRRIRIQASLFDVAKARALGVVAREMEGDTERLREKVIPRMARELAAMGEEKGNSSLWLFLVGGAGAATYLFTRDGGSETEGGTAEITGTFPPDAFPAASEFSDLSP